VKLCGNVEEVWSAWVKMCIREITRCTYTAILILIFIFKVFARTCRLFSVLHVCSNSMPQLCKYTCLLVTGNLCFVRMWRLIVWGRQLDVLCVKIGGMCDIIIEWSQTTMRLTDSCVGGEFTARVSLLRCEVKNAGREKKPKIACIRCEQIP